MLAFSDRDVIRMATEDYVSVAADDWYQRRRNDAEGAFFRKVADQGPRKGQGGSTRQGIYCLTPDGTLLAYRNAQDADVMRAVLRQGLRAWQKLPQERRRPGAVKVGAEGTLDTRYARRPPTGSFVVKVFTRILDRADGKYVRGTCEVRGGEKAARDHLWITASEAKALVPAEPKKGQSFPLPAPLVERILRFHLIDNTRGEPPMWRPEDIRSQKLTLTVTEVTPTTVRLRLEGTALLATDADAARAKRGFEVRLLGEIHGDRARGALTRFDVVAIGDHWGEGTFTRNARPGRQPLGVAFELAPMPTPADLVPPQAAREIGAYLGRTR